MKRNKLALITASCAFALSGYAVAGSPAISAHGVSSLHAEQNMRASFKPTSHTKKVSLSLENKPLLNEMNKAMNYNESNFTVVNAQMNLTALQINNRLLDAQNHTLNAINHKLGVLVQQHQENVMRETVQAGASINLYRLVTAMCQTNLKCAVTYQKMMHQGEQEVHAGKAVRMKHLPLINTFPKNASHQVVAQKKSTKPQATLAHKSPLAS